MIKQDNELLCCESRSNVNVNLLKIWICSNEQSWQHVLGLIDKGRQCHYLLLMMIHLDHSKSQHGEKR